MKTNVRLLTGLLFAVLLNSTLVPAAIASDGRSKGRVCQRICQSVKGIFCCKANKVKTDESAIDLEQQPLVTSTNVNRNSNSDSSVSAAPSGIVRRNQLPPQPPLPQSLSFEERVAKECDENLQEFKRRYAAAKQGITEMSPERTYEYYRSKAMGFSDPFKGTFRSNLAIAKREIDDKSNSSSAGSVAINIAPVSGPGCTDSTSPLSASQLSSISQN